MSQDSVQITRPIEGKTTIPVVHIGAYSGGETGWWITDAKEVDWVLWSCAEFDIPLDLYPDALIICDNGDVWGMKGTIARMSTPVTYCGNATRYYTPGGGGRGGYKRRYAPKH